MAISPVRIISISPKGRTIVSKAAIFSVVPVTSAFRRFESSFEHKASAVETVTPMKDADGTWRVSGYYIK